MYTYYSQCSGEVNILTFQETYLLCHVLVKVDFYWCARVWKILSGSADIIDNLACFNDMSSHLEPGSKVHMPEFKPPQIVNSWCLIFYRQKSRLMVYNNNWILWSKSTTGFLISFNSRPYCYRCQSPGVGLAFWQDLIMSIPAVLS